MSSLPIRCDIFCAVIDNFGDAGVCWRLARQLATEFGWNVRLLIDDATALTWLAPDCNRTTVEVRHFHKTAYSGADVVVEAFACEIPDAYQVAMTKRALPPVWLNLEYLSAEAWTSTSHGLASIHPRLGLNKHFFFPGFGPGCGGLIREQDYDDRRNQFSATKFRARLDLPHAKPDELSVSLFSYPSAPLAQLYTAWAASSVPVLAIVPGSSEPPRMTGNLRVVSIPFLSQLEYDELLWLCDLNFVRGEDSFVRAQWAAKPMVWQIYPQAEDAHLIKLDSFMTHYLPVGADETNAKSETTMQQGGRAKDALCAVACGNTPLADFWQAWNNHGALNWQAFSTQLPQLQATAEQWAGKLRQHPDLATNLRDFCLWRLKLG
ncbi:MAG: elongation factor P maturation arginine rhamnosyltransferase EarP [Rhodocyclaceae bacterium]|nr:elongation factor P maturation arginine rhamnosyltransferase EarP [Rhodocyclaceae bacterium]